MTDSFEARLLGAYPEQTWPTLTRGVREGVRIADDVRRSTPFLSTRIGGDLRGLLRRAAIMWRLQMLCRSSELPFKADEVLNSNGSSHLLSVLSNNIELHVVRTDDADAFPEDAPIRQDKRASNSADLFDDGKIVAINQAVETVPRLYGWIAWGATARGDLTHLCLAMPEWRQDAWLAHLNVLHRVLLQEREPKRTEVGSSAPNPALLLKFKAEIARSLEKDEEHHERGSDNHDD